jgi:hypothetical protein
MQEYSFVIDGSVSIVGVAAESMEEAKSMVEAMIEEGQIVFGVSDVNIYEWEA